MADEVAQSCPFSKVRLESSVGARGRKWGPFLSTRAMKITVSELLTNVYMYKKVFILNFVYSLYNFRSGSSYTIFKVQDSKFKLFPCVMVKKRSPVVYYANDG